MFHHKSGSFCDKMCDVQIVKIQENNRQKEGRKNKGLEIMLYATFRQGYLIFSGPITHVLSLGSNQFGTKCELFCYGLQRVYIRVLTLSL